MRHFALFLVLGATNASYATAAFAEHNWQAYLPVCEQFVAYFSITHTKFQVSLVYGSTGVIKNNTLTDLNQKMPKRINSVLNSRSVGPTQKNGLRNLKLNHFDLSPYKTSIFLIFEPFWGKKNRSFCCMLWVRALHPHPLAKVIIFSVW